MFGDGQGWADVLEPRAYWQGPAKRVGAHRYICVWSTDLSAWGIQTYVSEVFKRGCRQYRSSLRVDFSPCEKNALVRSVSRAMSVNLFVCPSVCTSARNSVAILAQAVTFLIKYVGAITSACTRA